VLARGEQAVSRAGSREGSPARGPGGRRRPQRRASGPNVLEQAAALVAQVKGDEAFDMLEELQGAAAEARVGSAGPSPGSAWRRLRETQDVEGPRPPPPPPHGADRKRRARRTLDFGGGGGGFLDENLAPGADPPAKARQLEPPPPARAAPSWGPRPARLSEGSADILRSASRSPVRLSLEGSGLKAPSIKVPVPPPEATERAEPASRPSTSSRQGQGQGQVQHRPASATSQHQLNRIDVGDDAVFGETGTTSRSPTSGARAAPRRPVSARRPIRVILAGGGGGGAPEPGTARGSAA